MTGLNYWAIATVAVGILVLSSGYYLVLDTQQDEPAALHAGDWLMNLLVIAVVVGLWR